MGVNARMGTFCSDRVNEPAGEVPRSVAAALIACPLIAAVNSLDTYEVALAAPTRAIYLLTGNPLSLPSLIEQACSAGKICLINIDFLDGLARDRWAVEFLAANKVAGVVSTRMEVLRAAQNIGLLTVQRTFAIDTAAVTAASKSLAQFRPDAVEVLPAMAAPRVAKKFRADFPDLPIIGGGLIEGVREIEDLLAAGINSVSTSNPRLWLV